MLNDNAMHYIVAGWTAGCESMRVLSQNLIGLQLQVEDTQRQLTELKYELAAGRKRYNAAFRRSKELGLLLSVIIGAAA